MKKLLSCCAFGVATLISCSKNNDAPGASGDLIGKWNLIKAVYVDTGTKKEETEPYDQGSYLKFDDNGICYSHVDGDDNSSNWKYIDNGKGIWIDNSSGFDVNDSGYTIQKLTANELQLYSKEILNFTDQQTLYLTR